MFQRRNFQGGLFAASLAVLGAAVAIALTLSAGNRPAVAHGTIDQQQLLATEFFLCSMPCGQSFTPSVNNIVAFDVQNCVASAPLGFFQRNATFTLREPPYTGPDLVTPFSVNLAEGLNHIDLPAGPLFLAPGTLYAWLELENDMPVDPQFGALACYTGRAEAAPDYPGGTTLQSLPGFGTFEVPNFDLFFRTYYTPGLVAPTPTSSPTPTRTPSPTSTPAPPPTPTPVPVDVGRLGQAFVAGAGRQVVAPVATSGPEAVIQPPSTGDAGLLIGRTGSRAFDPRTLAGLLVMLTAAGFTLSSWRIYR